MPKRTICYTGHFAGVMRRLRGDHPAAGHDRCNRHAERHDLELGHHRLHLGAASQSRDPARCGRRSSNSASSIASAALFTATISNPRPSRRPPLISSTCMEIFTVRTLTRSPSPTPAGHRPPACPTPTTPTPPRCRFAAGTSCRWSYSLLITVSGCAFVDGKFPDRIGSMDVAATNVRCSTAKPAG
jgi:hypothetical protein